MNKCIATARQGGISRELAKLAELRKKDQELAGIF